MPDLALIDSLLASMDRNIVDVRAALRRVVDGKLEMGELLTTTQKARLTAAIKSKNSEIESIWAEIKVEWSKP